MKELRVAVLDPDDAASWLDLVREDLEGLGPDEFRAGWGIA